MNLRITTALIVNLFAVTCFGILPDTLTAARLDAGGAVTLIWNSLPDTTYSIPGSDNLSEWTVDVVDISSQGTTTTRVLTVDPFPVRRFYKVVETP
jgi:hypothetical protein